MASKAAIRRGFQTFVALELRETPSSPEALAARIAIWEPLMPHVSDEHFSLAVIGYLLDPVDSEFFPRTPGKLLKYLPGKAEALVDDADAMFTASMTYLINYQSELASGDWPRRFLRSDGRWWRWGLGPDGLNPDAESRTEVPPPWTADKAEAVRQATEAMGGLPAWSRQLTDTSSGLVAAGEAERKWKRAYRSALRGEAVEVEGQIVRQITGGQRHLGAR
jgi:hypothetical protein